MKWNIRKICRSGIHPPMDDVPGRKLGRQVRRCRFLSKEKEKKSVSVSCNNCTLYIFFVRVYYFVFVFVFCFVLFFTTSRLRASRGIAWSSSLARCQSADVTLVALLLDHINCRIKQPIDVHWFIPRRCVFAVRVTLKKAPVELFGSEKVQIAILCRFFWASRRTSSLAFILET